MFDFLTSWLDQFTDFLNWLWVFITSGIYDFFVEIFAVMTKWAILTYIQSMIFVYDVALEVVNDLSADLGLAQYVESAYNSIPSDQRDVLGFFGIPQAVGIIFSAVPVRLAMKFVPIFGR